MQDAPDLMFSSGVLVTQERSGKHFGWRGQDGESFTRIEPALWTLSAISLKRSKGGEVPEEYYQDLGSILEHYDAGAGAWDLGPDQQPGGEHSVYESALAVMALLDARAAKAVFEVKEDGLDVLIDRTVKWISRQYLHEALHGGWGDGEDAHLISLGLTFQVYAALARADLEAGIPLDEKLFEDAGVQLAYYLPSALEHLRITSEYASPEGGTVSVQTLVALEPKSRAVECAVQWLKLSARSQQVGPRERLVRKALDRLIYHEGEAIVHAALEEPSFQLALWLNASGFAKDYFAFSGNGS
jgi:hypothetical protein